jgi:hypothetical protein
VLVFCGSIAREKTVISERTPAGVTTVMGAVAFQLDPASVLLKTLPANAYTVLVSCGSIARKFA